MKKFIWIGIVIGILICTGPVFGEKIAEFDELKKPTDLLLLKDNLYIMDSASVLVFNKKSGAYKFKFARQGEGPGEIKISPFLTNTLTLHRNRIAIDSLDRIIYYSPDGKFIEEKKKGRFLALQVKPIANHFVVKGIDRSNKKEEYIILSVYNNKMEKIKEIARQKSNIQLNAVTLIADSLHFAVLNNRIYVENSTEGFVIDVFDKSGNRIDSIRHKKRNLRVTEKDRIDAMERYKNDSLVKQFGFEKLKSRLTFIYGKTFPEIQDIMTYGDKIVVKTHQQKQNKVEYHIIDSKGALLKTLYLPKTWEGEMIAHLNGVEPKLFQFHKGFFYYLTENPDEEIYELHRIKI